MEKQVNSPRVAYCINDCQVFINDDHIPMGIDRIYNGCLVLVGIISFTKMQDAWTIYDNIRQSVAVLFNVLK